jgi:hypothetical protein
VVRPHTRTTCCVPGGVAGGARSTRTPGCSILCQKKKVKKGWWGEEQAAVSTHKRMPESRNNNVARARGGGERKKSVPAVSQIPPRGGKVLEHPLRVRRVPQRKDPDVGANKRHEHGVRRPAPALRLRCGEMARGKAPPRNCNWWSNYPRCSNSARGHDGPRPPPHRNTGRHRKLSSLFE